jgi:Protein of unknown function (DUF3489)
MEDTMPKLTDTQLVILSAAAKRDDGLILPLPKKLKLEPDTATGIFKDLIKKKLVAEQPTTGARAGRRDSEDHQPMMLVITKTGLRAIGAEPTDEKGAEAGAAKKRPRGRREKTPNTSSSKPRPGQPAQKGAASLSAGARPDTKLAKVIGLLRRSKGASIQEMMTVTGWQAHSVRGVISGALKKKLGLAVFNEKTEAGERRYRIDGSH